MSYVSGTARKSGIQFFSLETVRNNIEELKKSLFRKKKEYTQVTLMLLEELNMINNHPF